jgi:thioredoxin:protein disulfide reductase
MKGANVRNFLAAMVVLLAAATAQAGVAGGTDWLRATAYADHESVPQGAAVRVAVVLDLDAGYHVYANPPSSPDYIPVVVAPAPAAGIVWGAISYPPGERITPAASLGENLSVYTGRTILLAEARVADDAPLGDALLPLKLSFQGCSEEACYPPASRELLAMVHIVAKGAAPVAANAEIFTEADLLLAPPVAAPTAASTPAATEGEVNLADTFEQGFILFLAVLLLGGLALNLTPCVFPLIPVTMAFFAHQGESRTRRVLPLAVLYVAGLAATFTLVGVIAALAGKSLGLVLAQPAGVLAVVIVLAVMMASTFGAFEIRLPSGLMGKLGGRRGFLGAAVMGMVMGAVAAPCVGPFLFSLIAFIATKQSVTLGAISFFVTGLGLGLPYLALGLFTSQINRFPRGGGWLIWVKQAMGLALAGLILYYVQRFIDPAFFRLLVLALFVFAAVYLGLLEGGSRRPFTRRFHAVRIVTALAVLAAGLYIYNWTLAESPPQPDRPELAWTPWQPGAMEAAQAEHKPVLLYFGAGWCYACKEWHAGPFSDPPVIEATKDFVRLEADVTAPAGPLEEFATRLGGINPPLVVVLDRNGQVVREFRDPRDGKKLLQALEQVAAAAP